MLRKDVEALNRGPGWKIQRFENWMCDGMILMVNKPKEENIRKRYIYNVHVIIMMLDIVLKK